MINTTETTTQLTKYKNDKWCLKSYSHNSYLNCMEQNVARIKFEEVEI